jgi:hypothetical protein
VKEFGFSSRDSSAHIRLFSIEGAILKNTAAQKIVSDW